MAGGLRGWCDCGWWLGAVAVVAKATRSQEAARTLCYKFYELATGSDAVSVLGYVCVCGS